MTTTPDTTTAPGTTTTPDSTAMEPLARLSAAVGVAATTIDALAPAQYDRPTPCPPMSVGALAEHLVMALRRVALAGRDVPLAEWPIDAADVAAGTWGDALRAAGRDVEQAWADPALLERPTTLPWGTFPGREVLDVYTNEMVIHTWDLATATDQHPEWDPAVLEASLAVMHAQLPIPVRAPIWEAVYAGMPAEVPRDIPFADAVDVAEDAPLIDRLVAWNGRTP